MPLDNGAKQDAQSLRRTAVARYRAVDGGMTIRQIQQQLVEDGFSNPDTGKPWTIGVVGQDLQAMRLEWTLARMDDTNAVMIDELAKLDRLEEHAWAAVAEQVKQMYGSTELFDDDGKFIGKDPLIQELENIPAMQTVLKIMDRRAKMLSLDRLPKPDKGASVGFDDLLALIQDKPDMVRALLTVTTTISPVDTPPAVE